MTRVSIITAYYKNEGMTGEFLDNLTDKISEYDEVILVNAGSIPIHHDIVTKRIDLKENHSFSRSMNAGIKAASGDYIVVIGNDTFPTDKEWLDELIWAQSVTGADIVAPNNDRPGLSAYDRHKLEDISGKLIEYKMFPAICWLIPKYVIENIGLFDERFIVGTYEDDDYVRRVRNTGGKLVIHTEVMVRHLLSQTVGTYFDLKKVMHDNYRRYVDKWKKQ